MFFFRLPICLYFYSFTNNSLTKPPGYVWSNPKRLELSIRSALPSTRASTKYKNRISHRAVPLPLVLFHTRMKETARHHIPFLNFIAASCQHKKITRYYNSRAARKARGWSRVSKAIWHWRLSDANDSTSHNGPSTVGIQLRSSRTELWPWRSPLRSRLCGGICLWIRYYSLGALIVALWL